MKENYSKKFSKIEFYEVTQEVESTFTMISTSIFQPFGCQDFTWRRKNNCFKYVVINNGNIFIRYVPLYKDFSKKFTERDLKVIQ